MQLSLLKTKIHRATVTHAELNYEGSIAIDGLLLDASGIREFEQVHIWDVTNGARFSTYAIRADEGSGIISLNGGAARHVQIGDLIIIAAFAGMSRVARHRAINDLVKAEFDAGLHALAVEIAAPGEPTRW